MDLNPLTVGTAFAAGILSFVSPCCLPLVPAYLSYITGIAAEEFSTERIASRRVTIMSNAIAFTGGFSLIFALFGATATVLGQFLLEYQEWVVRVGGILVIVFGLHMLGVLKIPLLNQEVRPDFTKRRAPGFAGSVLMGIAFGVGWTPCVGPFLGSIFILASQTDTVGAGMLLLFAYGLGLGTPFVFAGLAVGQLMQVLRRIKRHMVAVSYASGGLLIVMGVLLFTNQLTLITAQLSRVFGIGLAQ